MGVERRMIMTMRMMTSSLCFFFIEQFLFFLVFVLIWCVLEFVKTFIVLLDD